MRGRRRTGVTRRGLAALVLLLGIVLGVAGPAAASCAGPASATLVQADRVFLGTVVEQRPGFDRFAVEEVWRGPDLAPQIWVQTGQRQPLWPWQGRAMGSNDAELSDGVRYVVGLYGGFSTNTCAVQAASAVDLTALRPADAREPLASGAIGAEPARRWWVLPGAGLLVACGAALLLGLVLRRRRAG